MKLKYGIFDMDGTLVDSMGYWKQLGREYLAQRGVTENVEEVLDQVKTMSIQEASELFIRSFGLNCTPRQLADDLNAVMLEHYAKDVELKPGVKEYLEAMKARGCRMGVATATARPLAVVCLERLDLMQYFDFVLSCEASERGKDCPDIFLEAAERLGAQPHETAVFEDALFAARTAKNAGFWTVGVWDQNSADSWEKLKALADETIADWRD